MHDRSSSFMAAVFQLIQQYKGNNSVQCHRTYLPVDRSHGVQPSGELMQQQQNRKGSVCACVYSTSSAPRMMSLLPSNCP